jgi:hypothetical protein
MTQNGKCLVSEFTKELQLAFHQRCLADLKDPFRQPEYRYFKISYHENEIKRLQLEIECQKTS